MGEQQGQQAEYLSILADALAFRKGSPDWKDKLAAQRKPEEGKPSGSEAYLALLKLGFSSEKVKTEMINRGVDEANVDKFLTALRLAKRIEDIDTPTPGDF